MSDRFWDSVARSAESDCWEFSGRMHPHGYGQPIHNGKSVLAHRLAFFLTHGRWPNACCLHRCDNRRCVNPAHLFEGTLADNVRDMCAKGRNRGGASVGVRHWKARLSEQDVRDIRAMYAAGGVTKAEIGRRYGVTDVCVCGIVNRKRWRHVP